MIWFNLNFGGGENRTLVLSKLHSNDYMLIAFFNTSILKEGATLRIDVLLSDLESLFQKAERIEFIPGFMTIVLMLLVRP